MNCKGCDRKMTTRRRRDEGECVHVSHGYCGRCESRLRDNGTLELKKTRAPSVPREVVLEEWSALHGAGLTLEQAAPRIGMSPGALKKALRRANVTTI